MRCDHPDCRSERILQLGAKCSDCCGVTLGGVDYDGYLPEDLGVGSGDTIEFRLCLDCGKLQGKFPLAPTKLEEKEENSDIADFYDSNFEGLKLISHSHLNLKWIKESLKKYHTIKFQNFVETFLSVNKGLKMPSQKEFLNMYLNNDCYVSE